MVLLEKARSVEALGDGLRSHKSGPRLDLLRPMVLLDLKPKGLCRARFLGEPLDGGPSRGLYRKCVHAVLSVAPTLGVHGVMKTNII